MSRRAAIVLALAIASGCTGLSAQSLSLLTAFSAASYDPEGRAYSTAAIRAQAMSYTGPFTIILTQEFFSPTPSAPASPPAYAFYKPAASPTYELDTSGYPSNSNQVLSGRFTKKVKTVDVDFALVVESAPLPPPGTYTIGLRADLYRSSFPVWGPAVDSLFLTATISVGTVCDIAVVPAGEAFSVGATSVSLSFGEPVSGAMVAADVIARSNATYSLSVTSLRGWALGSSDAADPLLPYALSSDGAPLSLIPGSQAWIATGADATNASGLRRRLVATMQDWPAMPSEGEYSDILTFVVSAP